MISIIIPTYNRAQTIDRAIRSVLNQTYKDIEVLVIDDCSNDDTEEIVSKIKDKRLKYVKLEKNSGACVARNKGIELAKGEYIAFQDSDDEWYDEKLQKQLDYLIANNFDLVSCKMYQKDKNRLREFPRKYINEDEISELIMWDNFISTQTILAKKACLCTNMFDPEMPRFQDWELVLRLKEKCRIGFLNEILVIAYLQEDSISNDVKKFIIGYKKIISKYELPKDIVAHYYFKIALYTLKNHNFDSSYIDLAYQLNNKNKRIYIAYKLYKFKLLNLSYIGYRIIDKYLNTRFN